MNKQTNYQRYMSTYTGQWLSNQLNESGLWEVFGEDPNCDLGGSHHEPSLGLFEGRLEDVIHLAVELPGFWQWGAGGRIQKVKNITVVLTQEQQKAKARADKEKKIADLRAQIAKLENE